MVAREDILAELDRHYFGPELDEREVVEKLPTFLDGCTSFLDIGASLGQYSYFGARAMRRGVVVALEADPLRYEALASRVGEWSRETGARISAIHAAATDVMGTCEFYVTDSSVSGGLGQHRLVGQDATWRRIEIPGTTVDDMWDGQGIFEGCIRPDAVKIDVEGAELRVLKGAEHLLDVGKTRFLVEVHSWGDEERGYKPNDVFEFMKRFGYRASLFGRLYLFEKRRSFWKGLSKKMFKH